MRIKLLTSIAGHNFSHNAGTIVDWPNRDEAVRLIAGGLAEPAPAYVERAVRPSAPAVATRPPAPPPSAPPRSGRMTKGG